MWKIALKISVVIVLLTIVDGAVFYFTKIEMPLLFCVVPLYFLLSSIFLAIFAKKNIECKNIMAKILTFRFVVVFCGILVLLAGLIFDRNNILCFTILFVIYYIVFSILETKAMVRLVNQKRI
ncbi:MAG: hypothetical protein LBB53_00620 [Prevotellaceae bacterium]|jgi:hypothetical protein|nr:hypothetical protein [Prevotellaceae bacterium]